jgi:hypothetical protein
MGILYDSVCRMQDAKRKIYLSRLLEKGISQTKDGVSIHDLDYYSLRRELVLSSYRETNIDSPENKWF